MSAVRRVGTEPVKLSEEQIHLIAKALADPRRYELLRQIGSCPDPVQCAAIKDCHPVTTREGKFASYLLRRDVLQAYTDQLAKI
jgi:ArsR family transcriptional regulator, arsenate/arsenite/antimonite-responsive transcriptional repressor